MPASKTKPAAFTLVELMTVITIITILIAVLLPSLSQARRSAKNVASQSALHAIEVGLEMFRNDTVNGGQYPPSHSPLNAPLVKNNDQDYTGANWLADTMVGPDLLGWDPRALSPSPTERLKAWQISSQITQRKDPYVQLDSIKTVQDISPARKITQQDYWSDSYYNTSRVLVDATYYREGVDPRGMDHVILYYRANPAAQTVWSLGSFDQSKLIYDYTDNWAMMARQKGAQGSPLQQVVIPTPSATVNGGAWPPDKLGSFYEFIENDQVNGSGAGIRRPHRADSYILISPGFDGLYGTTDDITNFKR